MVVVGHILGGFRTTDDIWHGCDVLSVETSTNETDNQNYPAIKRSTRMRRDSPWVCGGEMISAGCVVSTLRCMVVLMITFTFDDDTYQQLPRHLAESGFDALMRCATHVQRDDLVLKDRTGRGSLTFLKSGRGVGLEPTKTVDLAQPKFEYLWVVNGVARIESALDDMGDVGWEAVCMNGHGDLLMKRLKGSE